MRARGLAGLCLALLALGCDRGPGTPPAIEPPHRPADGLATDPALQDVVGLQIARDGAALAQRLASQSPAVRARAAFALGSVQDSVTEAALAAALVDPEAAVRRDAAFALGQLGRAVSVGALADALGVEQDGTVRVRILEALGKIGVPDAARALLSAEVRPGEEARRTLSLARLGAVRGVDHPPAQNHLLARLDDPDPDVRIAAAYYFGRLEDGARWVARVARVRQALDRYSLDDPAAMYLVQALGRIRDTRDLGRLRGWAAGATDWRTRSNAMAALVGSEADDETLEVLFPGLDDPSVHVAATAAAMLARGDQLPSVRARVRAWIEQHPDRLPVIRPLLVLMARMDEREFVFGWLDEAALDDEARWSMGLDAMAVLGGEEAVERLVRAAASPSPAVAGAAMEGLARRWSRDRAAPGTHARYFDLFSHAVTSGNVRATYAAAPVLADTLFRGFGNTVAFVEAFRALEAPRDTEAMRAVLAGLTAAGGPGAEETLRRTLRHPDATLRATAARGLEQLTGERVQVASAAQGPDSVAERAHSEARTVDWSYLEALGPEPRLVLETERGRVTVRLSPEEAPVTVQTVARLARAGRYDGVPFHRVVPNFVVQGGDVERGDGFGGPGFEIVSEFTLIPFWRGVIGMASSGKDTEGSQYFINHVMTPHLDGAYTSFGWVVEGMDVVDAIAPEDRVSSARIEGFE